MTNVHNHPPLSDDRRKDPGPGLIASRSEISSSDTHFRSGPGGLGSEVDREHSETVVVASHAPRHEKKHSHRHHHHHHHKHRDRDGGDRHSRHHKY